MSPTLRVLCDGLFENPEGQGAEDRVALVGDGVGVVARVRRRHLTARRPVSDLPDSGVQLDVQTFGKRDRNAGVSVANCQVTSGEGKSVILRFKVIQSIFKCPLH